MARGVQKDTSRQLRGARRLSLKQPRQTVWQLAAGIRAGIGLADFQPEPHEPGERFKRVGVVRIARHPALDKGTKLLHQ